jgi:hypothetical protein
VTGTNASRAKPYDQVLPGDDLSLLEIPVSISGHTFTYAEGLVFDSRVFTPLSAVAPVLAGDSGATGMQHMAVIRDFLVPVSGGGGVPASPVPGEVLYPHASGFTVTWDTAPGATGYRLDVSASPDFGGDGESLLSEGFDAGEEVPAGWVDNGTADDSLSSHYSSPGNCRALGPGDSLETPPVDFPTELRFHVDASGGGDGGTGTVSYSAGGGAWAPLGSFTVSTAGQVETIDLTLVPDLSALSGVRFRFESTFFTWYLDDVEVIGAPPSQLVPGYDDLDVGESTFHAVSGLDPASEYHVRIRAVNAHGSSPDSAVVMVSTRAAGSPFAVWASDRGIAPTDQASDFDLDGRRDFEEFVFGSDPTLPGSVPEPVTAESAADGFRITYRRSIAPGIAWSYEGGEALPLGPPALSGGTGELEYLTESIVREDEHEVVTLKVRSSGSSAFLRVVATPTGTP